MATDADAKPSSRYVKRVPCPGCGKTFKPLGLRVHFQSYPECKPAELEPQIETGVAVEPIVDMTMPANCVGHTWTFWQSVMANPVILAPAVLSGLIGALYVYQGKGVIAYPLLLLSPVLLVGMWWYIMRGVLVPVMNLYKHEGVVFVHWQWWPKVIADQLPDRARRIFGKKPSYALDRMDAEHPLRVFDPIEPDTIASPELTAGFTQLADIQAVNTHSKGKFKAEMIKTAVLVGIMIGLALGNYVIATKIMEG